MSSQWSDTMAKLLGFINQPHDTPEFDDTVEKLAGTLRKDENKGFIYQTRMILVTKKTEAKQSHDMLSRLVTDAGKDKATVSKALSPELERLKTRLNRIEIVQTTLKKYGFLSVGLIIAAVSVWKLLSKPDTATQAKQHTS